MQQQQPLRRLPPLTDHRLRRLRARLPLEVLAVRACIPTATLSRFERGAASLTPDQLSRLDATLRAIEEGIE
jgi:hypothetical protein